jgi:serine/threonine-protein kinase
MATPDPAPIPASPLPHAFQAGVFVPPLKRLSVPAQDLSGDKLLLAASRIAFEGRAVPALGGIPLLAKLGQGGMGAVYYGIHPRLYLEVAVKVLPFHLAEETPELVSRFLREARIAAQVKSPHLVGVLDVNEDQGLNYLVMEYVQGISAAGYLRDLRAAGHAGMPEPIALDICLAAAEGLGVAHAKGIVHRDVKPENILVPRSDDGRWLFSDSKLADLGLARGESQGQSLTGTQAHMGTPGYMAPEQARDAKTAEAPSDVFGLGATLYALLAGQAPFTGSSAFQVLTDTVQKPHRPLPELRPGVSPALAMIADRCLQKDPAQRYSNGSALAEALRSVRTALVDPGPTLTPWREDPTLRFAPSPSPAPLAAAASTVVPATTPQPQPPASSHVGRYVAAAAVLALLMLGGFLLWSRAGLERGSGSRKDDPPVVAEKTTETAKPVSPPAEQGESAPASAAAKEEAARRQLTEDRQKTFAAQLAEADGLLETDPEAALVKLDAAQALGAADAFRNLPDLLSPLQPSLEARREDAKARLQRRREETARKEREAVALAKFSREWESGKQAAELQDWKGAEERLTAALKELGELEHPDKAAADARLREIVAARQRREEFTTQIKAGQRALTEGDCAAAEKAFSAAVKLAPDAVGTREAENGLQACREARLKQRFQAEMDAGRAALAKKAWAEAQTSFGKALVLQPGDAAAARGLEECRAGARDAACGQALGEAEAARAGQKWAEALAACQRALVAKPNDAAAMELASGIRYDAAMSEGREHLAAADRLGAEAAFLRALREKAGDTAATSALVQARERPAPPAPPPPVANVEPKKPVPVRPEEPAFGRPNVIGTFSVYANRPSQGIPLDKKGQLVRIRPNMDKEQYEEATKTRRSYLQIEKGTKVRIEATGAWFSGPSGSWVGADGMRVDGTNTLKRFRAFEGPEDAYGIAKLIVFISEKNSVGTEEFNEIEKKGWRWGYDGQPMEFIMPETGTLRFQQNRDGYYDVTQGSVEVTVTLFEPGK